MKTTTLLKLFVTAVLVLGSNYAYPASALPHHGGKNTHKAISDSSLCLQLNGRLHKTGKSTGSFTVALLHNNTPVDSVVIENGNSFKFMLKKNTWYSVRISKPGSVSKLISVCTALPGDTKDYLYRLDFVIDELISDTEAEFLDKETLDFPMAIFMYDFKQDRFDYIEEYTTNIRKHMAAPIVGTNAADGLSTSRTLPKK